MNEIYDGVITKPELNEETLTHYGIAKKVHKYIDKYLKNGKWIYRYKSKALESATKFANKAVGINDPRSVVNNKKPTVYWFPLLGSSRGRNVVGTDNGKANSRSGQTGSRVTQGTAAGRKRAGVKKGNLSSRGYSGSRDSGVSKRVSNTGTRKSVKKTYLSGSVTPLKKRKRSTKSKRQFASNSTK